jgi:hypothetical protein
LQKRSPGDASTLDRIARGFVRGVAWAAPLLATTACSPKIQEFRAEPNVACPGSVVTLSWKASTGGHLRAVPLGSTSADLGKVAASGSLSVQPQTTTTYLLTVENLFGQASLDADVQISEGQKLSIGQSVADPSAGCSGGEIWVVAQLPTGDWDPQAIVGQVSTADAHRYHVEHAGKSADLVPGEPSAALAGVPVGGPWTLRAKLGSGEQCGTPSVPPTLGVQVILGCTPGH